MLRQPIVCVLGHVDHGKTTLLDKIRKTTVTEKEPGLITQHVGCTTIPINTIKKISGELIEKMKIKLEIPGLLILDTPGHEAFTSLRKRGGSCADLTILVVDINEGFQPQTDESLNFIKQFKTPFIVAATKIDKIKGWVKNENKSFTETYFKQPEFVREELDNKLYKLIGQLSERKFETERFDKVKDFRKTIAIVPCSGVTGEGIPELLMVLSGLSQVFLKDKIEITRKNGLGSILEVKELKGLGTTIDVILYDGEIHKGDFLIIGGKEPIVTRIKALLKPQPLKELRVEKQFESLDSVAAACGIKISAPNLENVIAGSPIISVSKEEDIEQAKKELEKEVEAIEFEKAGEGIVLKADTLGSLEALVKMLKDKNIEIKKAEVGDVHRSDIMGIESVDRLKKIVFAFNVSIDAIAKEEAKNREIKIFQNNVIYRLIEDYENWIKEETEKIRKEKLEKITRPGKIQILKGFVFRASNPAIVGVEVLEGMIKNGVKLVKEKEIGFVKELQKEGETTEKAEKGDKVAVSIEGGVVGRNIKEGDELFVKISKDDLKVLEELNLKEEIELAKHILEKIKH